MRSLNNDRATEKTFVVLSNPFLWFQDSWQRHGATNTISSEKKIAQMRQDHVLRACVSVSVCGLRCLLHFIFDCMPISLFQIALYAIDKFVEMTSLDPRTQAQASTSIEELDKTKSQRRQRREFSVSVTYAINGNYIVKILSDTLFRANSSLTSSALCQCHRKIKTKEQQQTNSSKRPRQTNKVFVPTIVKSVFCQTSN